MKRFTVYTIGHSSHSLVKFSELLKRHEITVVADVRSTPYSKHYPHFSEKALKAALKKWGIKYVFLGYELGGRGQDASEYVNGRVSYARLAQSSRFKQGFGRVIRGVQRHRIALMCAEKDPIVCHRGILIAPALQKLGVAVYHIHADGELETHEQLEDRLRRIHRLPPAGGLFAEDEALALAYRKQEKRIAYKEPS